MASILAQSALQRLSRCNATKSGGGATSQDDKDADTPESKAPRRPARAEEVQIITRDGVVRRNVKRPEDSFTIEIKKKGMEFVGLDFGDSKNKKPSSVTPAGLYAPAEPPRGKLPEVEIITAAPSQDESSEEDVYKPKVSTWGVFPRPSNISKTYGGGRTIQPGQPLETSEEEKAREARTRELVTKYKRAMGLILDSKTQRECQQMMEQGNENVKCGKLQAAVECYEQILKRVAFQNDLHGQAAMQKAICLDSLNRWSEARDIYEKLRSHPNYDLKKRAKQLAYTFQAADNLKLSSVMQQQNSYRRFFDVLSEDSTAYSAEERENEGLAVAEALALACLLLLPLLPIAIVILKR